jgi:curved DNA-binding protein CbpA
MDICKLSVKELQAKAKSLGLATKGLKKCQLILLIERNKDEEEFSDVEFEEYEEEYPDAIIQRLRFGDTKRATIPYSETKGKKSEITKTTRTLSKEDLKNFVPRYVLKKQAKEQRRMTMEDVNVNPRKNKFFELEEAMPSKLMYLKKPIEPIDIKRNWKTNYKVGKYLPMLEFESKRPEKRQDLSEEEITSETDKYKILGVNKSSSLEEIKRAYKKLSLKYHPDRLSNKSKEEQEKSKVIFQKISNAYQDILSVLEGKYSDKEMNEAYEEARKAQEEYERRMKELNKRFEEMRKESEEMSKQNKREQKEETENMMKNEKFRDRMIELYGMTKVKLIEEINKITDKKNMKREKLQSYGKDFLIWKIVNYEFPDDDIIIYEVEMKEYIKQYKKKQPQQKQKQKSKKPVPVSTHGAEEEEFSDVIFEEDPKPSKPKKTKPAPIIEYTEDEMEDLQNTINIFLDFPRQELNGILLEETGQDGSDLTEEKIIKKILIEVNGHPANIVNKMKIRLKKSTQQSAPSQPQQKRKSTIKYIQIIDEKGFSVMKNRPLSPSIQRAYEELYNNRQVDLSDEIQEHIAETLLDKKIIKYVKG